MSSISPKLLFLLAFSLVAFLVSSMARAATVPNHFATAPVWAELAKYPIIPAIDIPKTSIAGLERSADLGLRSVRLTEPVVMLNHYRAKGGVAESWRLETIATGTVVLVDVAGIVRYKADCWNRLATVAPPSSDVGFWDLIVKAFNGFVDWVTSIFASIAGFFGLVWGAFLGSSLGPEWLLVLPAFFAVWIAERQRQAAMGGNQRIVRQNVR